VLDSIWFFLALSSVYLDDKSSFFLLDIASIRAVFPTFASLVQCSEKIETHQDIKTQLTQLEISENNKTRPFKKQSTLQDLTTNNISRNSIDPFLKNYISKKMRLGLRELDLLNVKMFVALQSPSPIPLPSPFKTFTQSEIANR
jgi:hypothetical protein